MINLSISNDVTDFKKTLYRDLFDQMAPQHVDEKFFWSVPKLFPVIKQCFVLQKYMYVYVLCVYACVYVLPTSNYCADELPWN